MSLLSRALSATGGATPNLATQLQQEMDACDRAAGGPGALAVPKDEDTETWASIVGAATAGGEVEDAVVPLVTVAL